MFIFDYLIINRDRHGANLEVLKNNSIKLSPLFDNGVSFICTLTDTDDVANFNVLEDRPVNNFIGERSLEKNLRYIDKPIQFNELLPEHQSILFSGLHSIFSDIRFDKIWEILIKRWKNVAEFRVA